MADEVRLLDANKLLEDIEDAIDIERDGQDIKKSELVVLGLKIARKYVNKTPTVEATPCTFCIYNPPSSGDGKPCTMCPAVAKGE